MHLLRRAAVRTALLQPSRTLPTLRAPSTRAALFQSSKPTSIRAFHQARIWRADAREEASPVDAETTGETVPVETLEEAVVVEPFERGDVGEQFSEEAIEAAEAAENAAEVAVDEAVANPELAPAAEGTIAAAELAQEAAEVADTASEGVQFGSRAEASPEEVAAAASQTAQVAAEAATIGAAAAASSPFQDQPRQRRQPAQYNNSAAAAPAPLRSKPPSRILYIGNLFFEVTAQQLETEFAKFGAITNSRVVTDQRGLSKGFGYVEFGTQESADRAVREADQKVFQGRRMAVQYHERREAKRPGAFERGSGAGVERGSGGGGGFERGGVPYRQPSAPSKTLFIGNMSYQMSDRDLNDLFREIRDVLDVRVAIDRRSGQPRGFAHADFVDIPAAERAKEVLGNKVVYGRQLRVDFSSGSSSVRQEM